MLEIFNKLCISKEHCNYKLSWVKINRGDPMDKR